MRLTTNIAIKLEFIELFFIFSIDDKTIFSLISEFYYATEMHMGIS